MNRFVKVSFKNEDLKCVSLSSTRNGSKRQKRLGK